MRKFVLIITLALCIVSCSKEADRIEENCGTILTVAPVMSGGSMLTVEWPNGSITAVGRPETDYLPGQEYCE